MPEPCLVPGAAKEHGRYAIIDQTIRLWHSHCAHGAAQPSPAAQPSIFIHHCGTFLNPNPRHTV